jgi:Secretion system C-terminal sorting domain
MNLKFHFQKPDYMKKYNLLVLTFLIAYTANAQNNFFITPGAEVTVSGNLPIYLNNMNFVNNGTFNAGNGNIIMTGNSLSTISGNNSITFFNLTVNNSGGVTLNRNIAVNNELDMSGMMNLKNNSIALSSTAAIVNESNSNRLTDAAANAGNATTTRNFAAPLANVNPANLGVEFVSAPVLGNTTVTRYCASIVKNGSSAGLITRYYNIKPTNNTSLNASVRFYYFDAELNGVVENTAILWKSTDNGISWSQIAPDARNTTANWVQKNNVNDFSLWTVGNSNSTLPVILSSFNTQCKNNGAHLLWTTQTEINSDEFIIEKSNDAVNWKAIGTITANGTAADYNFNDLEAGTAYYRLKQVDNDGTYTYSKILKSNCEVKSITLMLYPNPATEYTELVFTSDEAYSSNILVFAANGQAVRNIQTGVQKGMNKIRINLSGLSNGTYIIKLNDQKMNLSKTFIKQ